MNTRIEYLYRDAANYKQWHMVVVAGEYEWGKLTPYLVDNLYFVPSAWGLENLQGRFGDEGFEFSTAEDHDWHELVSVEITDAKATEELCLTR